jgi:hypothetical protein
MYCCSCSLHALQIPNTPSVGTQSLSPLVCDQVGKRADEGQCSGHAGAGRVAEALECRCVGGYGALEVAQAERVKGMCGRGAGGGGVEHKLPHLLSFINPAVLIVMLPWKRRKLKEPEAYLWAHAGEGSV